jgi:hypothetical protein
MRYGTDALSRQLLEMWQTTRDEVVMQATIDRLAGSAP